MLRVGTAARVDRRCAVSGDIVWCACGDEVLHDGDRDLRLCGVCLGEHGRANERLLADIARAVGPLEPGCTVLGRVIELVNAERRAKGLAPVTAEEMDHVEGH